MLLERMEIKITLDENQKSKLVEVIEQLYKSNSIDSRNMNDFIKFTIFIVLSEYDKNEQSLFNFYKKNKDLYNKTTNYNKSSFQTDIL